MRVPVRFIRELSSDVVVDQVCNRNRLFALAIPILVYAHSETVHSYLGQVSRRELFHRPDYRCSSCSISVRVVFAPEKLPT